MTRDDVIRMARDAEWLGDIEGWTFNSYAELERFAALVAAAERSSCAKVCESFKQGNSATYIDDDWADMCAAAIRARSKT